MSETPNTSQVSMQEFIVLIALLMSIVAISIDAMLPALGVIGGEFHITNSNHVQYLIGIFFAGMSAGQLVCGPASDAMGRKPVLYCGIFIYLIGTAICFFANSFGLLLIGRLIEGLGVAGPYVTAVSVVRDRYSGRDMARVMSVIMMIFILVPAIAPSLGQGIMLFASWRYLFVLYVVYALVIAVWIAVRLEETLPPSHRVPFNAANIVHGFKEIIRNRTTVSYMACAGISFGSFIGYLNSSQQIFQGYFNTGKMFTVYFGVLALILGIASLINSRFVRQFGMRFICIRSTFTITVTSALFLVVNLLMHIDLWMFLIYAAILFFSFGLMFGNLNSIAMEPMGHIAGIASAVIGATSSCLSLVLGSLIGQLYDNSLIPVVSGFLILGCISFVIMVSENSAKGETDETLSSEAPAIH